MRYLPAKTEQSTAVTIDIPVLPPLAAEIEAMGNDGLTLIETEHGKPFTTKGLGNRIRKWCDEAGLPHCSAHGLRKAGATIAAENGADYETLKAIWGWVTERMPSHYVRSARRTKLAANAGKYLHLDEIVNK